MPDVPATRYYTVAQAAAILGRSPYTVWSLCRDHKIPATKPAGTWLIPIAEFDAWLEAGRNEAASA